jgi:hypothetical protein
VTIGPTYAAGAIELTGTASLVPRVSWKYANGVSAALVAFATANVASIR